MMHFVTIEKEQTNYRVTVQ